MSATIALNCATKSWTKSHSKPSPRLKLTSANRTRRRACDEIAILVTLLETFDHILRLKDSSTLFVVDANTAKISLCLHTWFVVRVTFAEET